jgi:hypothetical protein
LLFQAGYLTIDKAEELPFGWYEYRLKIPNLEIKMSLNNLFLTSYFNQENINDKKLGLYKALRSWDVDWFVAELKSLFAKISYTNYTNNEISKYEGYYSAIVYTYLESLWYEIIWEDVTNRGRIDLTIKTEDKIYIIEFKMSYVKEKPMEQIEKKKYYEKYMNEWKEIYLVGMVFDEGERNIIEYEWKIAGSQD